MYSPKISPDLIPRLYQLAKALKIPMTRLVNSLLEHGMVRLEQGGENVQETPKTCKGTTDHRQTKRWLRALGIAKILFEDEGYHITYLNEIEQSIVASQPVPQVAEDGGGYRERRLGKARKQ